MLIFTFLSVPLWKELLRPLVMGQGQIKTIQTEGQTSGNTGIMVIKEHKICLALSESLYRKQAYFQVFDSTSIERALAPPSDGSGLN